MSFGSTVILEKLQVHFAKERRLCFLSHHDLMRTFHRALRRAGLPVSLTKGYNPRPRVIFPHALEVGIPSASEVAEIELDEWVAPAEFARRLSEALPEGLTIREVKLIAPRRKGSRAVEAVYVAELGAEDLQTAREGVKQFLESDTWKVERPQVAHRSGADRRLPVRGRRSTGSRRPRPESIEGRGRSQTGTREVDIRPHVIDLALDGPRLVMRLKLGAPGAARPREVLAAVLGRAGDPMLDIRLKKTKTVLTAPA